MRDTDEDFVKFVGIFSKENPVLAREICFYILNYCGGHALPTLSFIEFFFTDPEMRQKINTMENFLEYFNGSEFNETSTFKLVKDRCFELTGSNAVHVSKVLGGVESYADIKALEHLGWWNSDKQQFISALIKNLCLEKVQIARSEGKKKFTPGMFEENSVMAIKEGFLGLQDLDFQCILNDSRRIPIENALSYRWSLCVLDRIANATLRSQESSEHSGHVDFFLNSFSNCAIEFIRNATLARPGKLPQSTDIDTHLLRFTSNNYHWKRFFIVNFSMERKTPVLPSDASYHDRIFTYVHSTNILYRGNKFLCKPAVLSLPCPMVQGPES